LFADAGGFEPAHVYRDYAGKERVIAAAKISAAGKGSNRG
jgi:hypothetical protein